MGMSIHYKGYEKKLPWRLAEVHFTDDELDTMIRIEKLLWIKGYTDFSVVTDGYAAIRVEDYDEYRDFVEVWKEVKRCIKNCQKYGF